jgi:hypothetical protein
MDTIAAADLVRYVVTGQGGIDLRGQDLTVHQACDKVIPHLPAPAIAVTKTQVYRWALELRTPELDTLLGVPLLVTASDDA